MAMTPYTGETLTIANIGTTPQERAMETSEFKMAFSKDFHEFVEWFNETHNGEINAHMADYTSHKAENANLSVLGHVNHAVLTATLDTTWSGTSAPFSKTVTVSGILSTDTPIIDVVMSGTYSTDEARAEAWGYIYRAVTGADSITFYATDKPTVDLPIQIRVVR